jgi:hypothetical protein
MEKKEMTTPNFGTMRKLLKTLSAVRKTLSDDEQSLLDQLIATPAGDVEAHLRIRPGLDADDKSMRGIEEAKTRGPVGRKLFLPDERTQRDADDVEAHSRPFPEDGMWVEIYFDPETESYQELL